MCVVTARYIRASSTFRVVSLSFDSKSNCEPDSHADTCVLGKHAHILWIMKDQLTLLGMTRVRGHLQIT